MLGMISDKGDLLFAFLHTKPFHKKRPTLKC